MVVGRVVAVAVAAAAFLLAAGSPAAASHDPYGPGTVVLHDGPGPDDRVEVVYPRDADEATIRTDVQGLADSFGVELTDVRVVENTDPDTLRVIARTRIGEHAGFLARIVPAESSAPWRDLGNGAEVYLSLSRWASVDGIPAASGGDYPIPAGQGVAYRISPSALLIPLLVLIAAVVLPYVALGGYGARVTRRGLAAEEALHRIRRALVAVQIVVPLALVAAVFVSDTGDWPELVVAEIAPGLHLPRPVTAVLAMLAFMLPFLAALAASFAAVVPYDRRLRHTEQTTAAGVGQGMRATALVLVPMMLWLVLLAFLPQTGGLAILPLAALFGVAMAALGPLLMTKVMTTRAVDEPLRRRVLNLCAEHGLRVREVRILDSRGGKVANAAISGVLPNLRYVFPTDHLLDILDDDEVEAVLAHEIGHGKGHHLLAKLGLGLLVLAALLALVTLPGAGVLAALMGAVGPVLLVVAFPILMIAVLVLVHGVLGVALEKRADDYAVRSVGAAPLKRALEKLTEANAMKRRTGWLWNILQQHPGMEQRITRLTEQRTPDKPKPEHG